MDCTALACDLAIFWQRLLGHLTCEESNDMTLAPVHRGIVILLSYRAQATSSATAGTGIVRRLQTHAATNLTKLGQTGAKFVAKASVPENSKPKKQHKDAN